MTPEQCRAARMAAGFSASVLAKAAGLKRMAVERLEAGEYVPGDVHDQLQHALEAAGIEFVTDDRGSSGVRLLTTGRGDLSELPAGTIAPGSNPPRDEDAM